MADLSTLEARLGYTFKDKTLLDRALTHSSLSGGAKSKIRDLERLEFLGDRVLGLLTAEELWRRFPDYEEGMLAPRFNALVRKETCAKAAVHFSIDQFVKMSDYEEQSGGRKKKAILGDVMEAMLGAIYIDGGLEESRKLYEQFWTPNIDTLSKRHLDAKTALQEWSQKKRLGTPGYKVIHADGPDHAPDFTVDVSVKGHAPARGRGRSKREAQTNAAHAFLVREKIWNEND